MPEPDGGGLRGSLEDTNDFARGILYQIYAW
jgi:hypothetical protein